MSRHEWTDDANAALFTDLYQLTMLQAYFEEKMDEVAVFDLFVRRLKQRNYLVAAGLDTALHFLETVRFSPEALEYLSELDLFSDRFLTYLESFRFAGDVWAIPEGTAVFPDEPLLQVEAPIGQAQLVETFLLNQVTFQTGLASKASRIVHAADGRTVSDFGARRMHGTDASLHGARAYIIAGIDSTSNVLAGMTFGMDVAGTMAHSYIEAHDSEADAFRAFASLYPGTTLLVDTYDTVRGVEKIARLSEELGDEFQIGAIRLDSGDLAELAKASRRILDDAGLDDARIFASGGLDEYGIADLINDGAPIDAFGVGTSMGTMADQPYLDTAYKLTSYAGEPRMKLSTNKANLPGLKQVYRLGDGQTATRDIIARRNEEIDGEPLLRCVMRGGERTEEGRVSLDGARQNARDSIRSLPEELRRLEKADPAYRVDISEALKAQREAVRRRLKDRES